MLYSYNDLVWEAVRRNQEYKKYYNNLKDGDGVAQPKNWDPYLQQRWYLKRPFDFKFSADDIIRMIQDGEITESEHPYDDYYESRRENVELEELPMSNYVELSRLKRGKGTEQVQQVLLEWSAGFCLKNRNRITISIDPYENENSIVAKIIEIKKNTDKIEKNKLNEFIERLDKRIEVWRKDYMECHLYHSRVYKKSVFNYIENLEKYDDIFSKTIKLASKSDDKSLCRIVCGALYLPKNFKFRVFLDDDEIDEQKLITVDYDKAVSTNNDKLMSKVTINAIQALEKYYKRSYKTAATMIRSAPDRIHFYS